MFSLKTNITTANGKATLIHIFTSHLLAEIQGNGLKCLKITLASYIRAREQLLKTEAGHGNVLSIVSRIKVRGVGFVVWLRYERHRLVLQVVPVQAVKQGVALQF